MIFRVDKVKDYVVMSNHHLRDNNLSLKAKGLLSLMLSLPEDWNYTLEGLTYIVKEGIESVRNAVRELELNGYLCRYQNKSDKGKFEDIVYQVYESPITDRQKPLSENPISDNPRQINIERQNKDRLKEIKERIRKQDPKTIKDYEQWLREQGYDKDRF